MKIHGSIEASALHFHLPDRWFVSMNENSWLYWSFQVLRWAWISHAVSMNENSWLYWSAAASLIGKLANICFHEWKFMALLKLMQEFLRNHIQEVSMNENSWLYWSLCRRIGEVASCPVSMNENSWLYWSIQVQLIEPSSLIKFPWMKIHGSIEARNRL